MNRERINGKGSVHLRYNDIGAVQQTESFCTQFLNCLKGSADYRDLKIRSSLEGINSVSLVDKSARALFPLAFVIFHIFYWISYLNAEDQKVARV